MGRKVTPLPYASTGVNYEAMDPVKVLAQTKARATSHFLNPFGMSEMVASRGESAYVWEENGSYRAFVVEGLGTKNRVADEMKKITGKSYYDLIAQDTVAMIVNDLVVVGAYPQVINAYFAAGSPKWFEDTKRSTDLVEGWAKACHLSQAVWGGGETPTLTGIINSETIDLAGSAVGIIKPKKNLTLGDKLKVGDAILLIESNGIHANGITLARTIAGKLPKGYKTKLSDGNLLGEVILNPTHIYVSLVKDLFEAGVDIHYMVHITGHGWRKIMRANQEFTYVLDQIPTPQSLFDFIQEHSGNGDLEMYGNFNMGAGFAIFLPEKFVGLAQKIAQKNKLRSYKAGYVDKGPKQVIIKPKNITFDGSDLKLRS